MTNITANSVDPDETGRNEPSHQDLHCLPFFFFFFFLFIWMTPICNNGYIWIQRWMNLRQKLRGERLKSAVLMDCSVWCFLFLFVWLFRVLTLQGTPSTWRQRLMCYACVCTALRSWITHAHLVPLSVTKCLPVHFKLNPGYVGQARCTNGLNIVSTPSGIRTNDGLLCSNF